MGHIENKEKTDAEFTGEKKQKWKNELIRKRNSTAIPGTRELPTWSIEETEAFLKVVEKKRHPLIFKLALYAGMRQEEILRLTWEDIDSGIDAININGHHKKITTRKQKNVRQILLPELMVNELVVHREKQKKWIELAGEFHREEDLVFCTNTGSALSPRIVNREMKQIIKEAKVKEIHFSDLRYNPLPEEVNYLEICSTFSTANLTLEYYLDMAKWVSKNRNHQLIHDFSKENADNLKTKVYHNPD